MNLCEYDRFEFLTHCHSNNGNSLDIHVEPKAFLWSAANCFIVTQPFNSNKKFRILSVFSLNGTKVGLKRIMINFKIEFNDFQAMAGNFGDVIYQDERFFVLPSMNRYIFVIDLLLRRVEKVNLNGVVQERDKRILGVLRKDENLSKKLRVCESYLPVLFKVWDELIFSLLMILKISLGNLEDLILIALKEIMKTKRFMLLGILLRNLKKTATRN